jgi:threonine/homoserine/homoserine lactone efflux protein
VVEFALAVLPSAGVLFLFYLGVKALIEADRRERGAQARIDGQIDRRADGQADGPDRSTPDDRSVRPD